MTEKTEFEKLKSAARPNYILELKQSSKGDVYGSFSVCGDTKEEVETKVTEMVEILNKHTSFGN